MIQILSYDIPLLILMQVIPQFHLKEHCTKHKEDVCVCVKLVHGYSPRVLLKRYDQ